MRHYTDVAVLLTAALALAGCGSSGGSGTSSASSTSPTISDVGDLPLASSKVVGSTSSSLSKSLTKALASSGLKLKTMSSSSFTSQSSLAMCENANMIKSAFNEAVQGDMILCYVKAMDTAFAAVTGLNVYDGDAHVFKLDFGGGDDDFRVKLKITENSAGSITNFQMWACEGATQSEYLQQTISGTDFTMTSKYVDGTGVQTWSGATTVTGTLNSSNQFTAKTIVNSNSFGQSSSSGYGTRTVVQGAENATISAWEKGSWAWEGGSGTFNRKFCSDAELLSTDAMATIAMGSGAAKGNVSGTYNGGSYNDDFTEGWNGDSKLAQENAILTSLSCTIPSFGTETTIAFSGDEVFDCSLTGATTLTVNDAQIEATCSDLSLGWDWVNCWDVIN